LWLGNLHERVTVLRAPYRRLHARGQARRRSGDNLLDRLAEVDFQTLLAGHYQPAGIDLFRRRNQVRRGASMSGAICYLLLIPVALLLRGAESADRTTISAD